MKDTYLTHPRNSTIDNIYYAIRPKQVKDERNSGRLMSSSLYCFLS